MYEFASAFMVVSKDALNNNFGFFSGSSSKRMAFMKSEPRRLAIRNLTTTTSITADIATWAMGTYTS